MSIVHEAGWAPEPVCQLLNLYSSANNLVAIPTELSWLMLDLCAFCYWFHYLWANFCYVMFVLCLVEMWLTDRLHQAEPFWEGASPSLGQEILCLLWNQNFITIFTRAGQCIPSWDSWIQSIPSQAIPSRSILLFNIIFQSMPRSPKWSLPFRFTFSLCYQFRYTH
jgi:hypothetical protein